MFIIARTIITITHTWIAYCLFIIPGWLLRSVTDTLIILSFFPIVKFCKGNPMNFLQIIKVDEHISEYHDMYHDDDPVFKQAIDDIVSSIKKICMV